MIENRLPQPSLGSGPPGDAPIGTHRSARPPALRRTVADLALGVLLPLACLVVDPFVIIRIGYVFFGGEMVLLAAWLLSRGRSPVLAGLLAGPLEAGALIALIVAICLIPSCIAFLPSLGMGLAFLAPFPVAFVYRRNAGQAFRLARTRFRRWPAVLLGVAGLLASLLLDVGLQLVAQRVAADAVMAAIGEDAEAAEGGLARLRWIGWAAGLSEVEVARQAERKDFPDPRAERIHRALRSIDPKIFWP